MDRIRNPFSPGAGSPPPELAGRDRILEEARVLLGRVKARKPEKSLLLTGLRGVGKTVLLNEMERMAVGAGYLQSCSRRTTASRYRSCSFRTCAGCFTTWTGWLEQATRPAAASRC